MGDLISRRALLAEYDRQHEGEPGKARKLIADAPAVDAVEVVRCKDCKMFLRCCTAEGADGRPDRDFGICNFDGLAAYGCGFCSNGERKAPDRE